MDENPKTIMTGFAPLDFVVAMVSPSITESIIASWDSPVYELAEKAKDRGIKGINDFMLLASSGKEQRYGYNILDINQMVLNKLLAGKIKTIEQLRELKYTEKQSKPSTIYTLFYTEVYDQDLEKYITTIDSIFINN
ncbi:hypothetical protein ACHRV6_17400 [Flavobacterium sp. FlaQc-51]|uniref:hypothetical protein n=1 Tax=Flavobacterium sp. FlaQc-51 TaxID=3374184 RepID=UPI003756764D